MATHIAESSTWARVLDQYSLYDYKAILAKGTIRPVHYPSWVPKCDRRRLVAYGLLESMYRNAAREWLDTQDEEVKRDRREYGDPNLLVNVTLTSLLGNQQTIVVEGAIDGQSEDEQADPEAKAQQELLEKWAKAEKFKQKMWENERQAVKYGDSVMVLGIDDKKKRPRINVYDPGFYFPIMDPRAQGAEDYPRRVHIAYEYEEEDPNNKDRYEIYVRRITWELVETDQNISYPWNEDPTNETCIYTDAIWKQANLGEDELDEFDLSQVDEWISGVDAEGNGGPVDLEIDFIPVVHVPNTIALQNHFGDSILGPVMQILDDIVANDTDIQAAASTTGTPPIAVGGASLAKDERGRVQTYGPGTVFEVGEGNTTVIDTSGGLTALLNLKDALLERLSVNSRTPEALLGRVKPNEVPSGIALTLSFAPHASQIQEMREVRSDKNGLILKFVSRMYVKLGQLKTVAEANIKLGSFLPADKQEAMTLVVQLYTSKAISLETAITILMDAGYPIEDWLLEIDRIQSRDFSGANELAVASGDANAARDYLGLPDLTQTDLQDPFVSFNDPAQEQANAVELAKAQPKPVAGVSTAQKRTSTPNS